MKTINVIQESIVRFGNYRQAPTVARNGQTAISSLLAPGYESISYNTNTVGVGYRDWAFQKAGFLNPSCTSHFAIPVKGIPVSEYWIIFLFPWKDDGHTGSNRTPPYFQVPPARYEGGMASFNSFNICDGI